MTVRAGSNSAVSGGGGAALRLTHPTALSHPTAARTAAMPIAMTELSELLAGDDTICVRRPPVAVAPSESRDAETPESASASDNADPQLARVVQAWPRLPGGIQSAIVAMVDAVGESREL